MIFQCRSKAGKQINTFTHTENVINKLLQRYVAVECLSLGVYVVHCICTEIVVFTLQQKDTKLFQYKNKQIISPSSSYYSYKTFILSFLAGNPEGMESLMGFSGFGKIFLRISCLNT